MKEQRSISARRVGRPMKYVPETLESKFDEYRVWVKQNPAYHNKVSAGVVIPVPIERPLTIVGFCNYAGIDKDTFRNYEHQEEFFGVCARVRARIETDQLEGALVGIYDAGIVARVLHLADRTDVTTNGKPIQSTIAPINVSFDADAAKIIQSIGKMTSEK